MAAATSTQLLQANIELNDAENDLAIAQFVMRRRRRIRIRPGSLDKAMVTQEG